MATCVSNDLVYSGLRVSSCMASLFNCSEPSGAKCYARTHNDMEAQAGVGLSHYHSGWPAFIGFLTVNRLFRTKPLPGTWTSCLQWTHIAYWHEADGSAWSADFKCLHPTVANKTLHFSLLSPNQCFTLPPLTQFTLPPPQSRQLILKTLLPANIWLYSLGSLNDTLPLSISCL